MIFIDVKTIETLISNFGFPMVMVAYFIWDRQKTIIPLIDAINGVNTVLTKLFVKIDSEEILVKKEGEGDEK